MSSGVALRKKLRADTPDRGMRDSSRARATPALTGSMVMSSGVVATRRASTRATGFVRSSRPRRGARAEAGAPIRAAPEVAALAGTSPAGASSAGTSVPVASPIIVAPVLSPDSDPTLVRDARPESASSSGEASADSAQPHGFPPPRLPSDPRSTTRWPIAATNAGSCVIDTRVTPRARAARRRRTRPSQVPRSCPKVGSSRMSSSGALMSAVATDRRRFSPPESVMGLARARVVRPRATRCSSTRGAISSSLMPAARGPMASSSATVEARNWYSGSWKTMDIRPNSCLLDHSWGSPRVPSEVSTSTVPAMGLRRPARVSAKVDLPAPLAPTMQVDTPRSSIRLIPLRTGASWS